VARIGPWAAWGAVIVSLTDGDLAPPAAGEPWWTRIRRRIVGAPATPAPIDRTSATPRVLTREQCLSFAEHGYLILRGFFAPATVAAVRDRLESLWAARDTGEQVPIDVRLGQPRERRLRFRNASLADRAAPYKISDLHLHEPTIQALSADPRLLGVVADLLSAPPVVMHSILLEHGSQQPAHFDTFYMPSATPNLMAAAWVAIDPVTPGNGALFYYPGSHLIPPYRFSNGHTKVVDSEYPAAKAHIDRVMAAPGARRREFLADPGDVLIWHAQLLHGGAAITDPDRTRLSLVTHYWTTHDVTRPDQLIDLGGGRLLLDKRSVTVDADELDAFLAGLTTPKADRAAAPPHFDPRRYLLAHPDVFFSRTDPYSHYRYYGQAEGRTW
jgi:ectoine hydroxylase-related dioxygenase (phytanoyl-CoA dioxygenase family)